MSDLKKTETEIAVASTFARDIERALPDDRPAPVNDGSRPHRWPKPDTFCGTCNHKYSEHNYSDSLPAISDPLGWMYECRGEGFDNREGRAECKCKKFELPSFFTSEGACLNDSFGQHICPGAQLAGSLFDPATGDRRKEKIIFCECTCGACLSASREARSAIIGEDDQPTRGVMLSGNGKNVFTNIDTCVVLHARGCPVVDTSTGSPLVCRCECRDCKRAWFVAGRPIVRVIDGARVVVRENDVALIAKIDEVENKPVVIPPPPSPATCTSEGLDGIITVRCSLPPGHEGVHRSTPLFPGRKAAEWVGPLPRNFDE